MEKSLQLTSKLMLHKCSKPKFFWGDRISQLPDDILVNILSFLTMKEAACTSILSHRWKNLWTSITCLDFDACKVLSEIRKRQRLDLLESLSAARFKYVRWVNQILNSHKGGTIDKFRVSFDLNYFFRSDIDKWIEFAIQKRVRWLEVDFQCVDSLVCEYPFPVQLFGNPNTNFLTALNLNYLEVTGENLEYLLSNCPCLEILRVSNSPFLFDLKVFGASLKLKYLEITHCPSFIFLEISAVNLTALTYTGPRITLRLRNVPNLAVVSFGGDYYERAIYKFSNLFTPVVSQTEILTLDLDSTLQKFFCLFETCKFPNLKQLELIMMTNDDHHMLLSCTKFLKACPVLYKFTLELKWFGPLAQKERGKKLYCIKKLQCLKVLELRGFHGRIGDVALATYLFENAAFLEKVTVDTRIKLDLVGSSQANVENEYVENGETLGPKECARQLARELCPQAELFIL